MPSEIAYKLTAEEKQAVDAIRKVAEAYGKVEGGVKKVSEETKKAKKEQAEMGRLAKRIMEEARTPAERYCEQIKKIDQLYLDGKINIKQYEDATRRAHNEMIKAGNAGQTAFGQKALGAVKNLAAALGVGSVLYTAINVIRGEYQAIIDLQERVKTASLGVADAEAAALRNLGPKSEDDVRQYLKQVEQISRSTGVSQKDINNIASEALSARGDLSVQEAMRAVEAGVKMAPDNAETAQGLAGGALDIKKAIPNISSEQAVGYMMKVAKKARLTDVGEVSRALGPILTADMASGGNEASSSAMFAALSQMTADPHGRRTKTAGIQFLSQLAKYLPEKGEVYSEEKYQHDKTALARERRAEEQAKRHAIKADPEYLQQMREIAEDRRRMPRLKATSDPSLRAVQDMRRKELAEKEQLALEDAERRVTQSPQFARLEESFTLRGQALDERRGRAKKVIATGMRTNEERLLYLQAHPSAAKKFMEMSTFEKVAETPFRQLVTNQGRTAEMYKSMVPDIGRAEDAQDAYDRPIRFRNVSPRQRTADVNRRLASGRESVEASPEMQDQALIGIVMEHYGPLLQDAGESAISTKVKTFLQRANGNNAELTLNSLIDDLKSRREARLTDSKMSGEGDLPWYRRLMPGDHDVEHERATGVRPTPEQDIKAAEVILKLVNTLEEVGKIMKENTTATRDNTRNSSPENRSSLGSRHGDPGDRY